MGELWRDLTELLRRHPMLWVPVLAAEFLTFWLKAGVNTILRSMLMRHTEYHSALGGSVRTPLNQSAVQSTTLLAIPLSWSTNFLGLLLYAAAFVTTAALVWAYLDRNREALAQVGPALRSRMGGMVELALRALLILVLAALFAGYLARFVAAHHHAAFVQNAWFSPTAGLLVMLLLAYFLAGPALRTLTGHEAPASAKGQTRTLAFILILVAAILSFFVGANSAALMRVPPGARLALGMVGALVTALPYALLYTGTAVIARHSAPEQPVT